MPTSLIHTVADLIDERDREGLEATLARVFFVLAGAHALILWRVLRRGDSIWLRKRVVLPATDGGEPYEDDLPLAAAPEPLRLAYASKTVARWLNRPDEPARCVLPVQGASEILGLLEIERMRELNRERISTLTGMLRIYRSHLAALDYGEIDELTRLANRRTFEDCFRGFALSETRRTNGRSEDGGARAHLGVADIDHFKQVNDRFGHPYGDEVLVLFAALMRDTFREADELFRFGGEEFVILVADCALDQAMAAFERFRAAVEAFPFPQVGRVTVSVGVTSLRFDDTGSAAFGRADQALYVAKSGGRNLVLNYEGLQNASVLEAMRKSSPEVELF